MTSRRATRRRRLAEDPHKNQVPVVPGIVPDILEATKLRALRNAHDALPPLRNSQVSVVFYPIAEGLDLVDQQFAPGARAALEAMIEEVGGDDPHVVIAGRIPRTPAPRKATR